MAKDEPLIGRGLYTPADAARLTGVGASRIVRWLSGYRVAGHFYPPLWQPEVDLGDTALYLGFLDLLEVRVAKAIIDRGLSLQSVRKAIAIARDELGRSHPLATHQFSIDGKRIILSILDEGGDERALDLLLQQFVFKRLILQSLKDVDFDDDTPLRWWLHGKQGGIVVDPARSFGRPLEAETGVPVDILSRAVDAEGSLQAAARAWSVPLQAVRRARSFCRPEERQAA